MGTVPRPSTDTSPNERSPRPDATTAPADVSVQITDLTIAYGSTIAVRDVDLTFHRGTSVAIIGPNGSGKSTLLGAISGLVRPTRGRVELGRAGRRPVAAHVLQTTVANEAVPLTVLETIRMGCYGRRGALGRLTADDRRAVRDAVQRMRIGDLVGRQLHELSGGQRQRTYVAQGLAQKADILLLDEPITGLDLVTQETITSVIRAERDAGRTVVLTTHDVGTAELADLVVLLATEVVAAGTPAQVLTPANLAAAYGRHVHVLDDGTVVLDETHHHDHRHHDQLGPG